MYVHACALLLASLAELSVQQARSDDYAIGTTSELQSDLVSKSGVISNGFSNSSEDVDNLRPKQLARSSVHRIRKYALGLPSTSRIPNDLKLTNRPEEWIGLGKTERSKRRRSILGLKRGERVPEEWQKLSLREVSHVETVRQESPNMSIAQAVTEARDFYSRTSKVALPGSVEPAMALQESMRRNLLVDLPVPKALEGRYDEHIRNMDLAQMNARIAQEISYPSWYHSALMSTQVSHSCASPMNGISGRPQLRGCKFDLDLNEVPTDVDDQDQMLQE